MVNKQQNADLTPESPTPEMKVLTAGPRHFFTNGIEKIQRKSVVKEPKQGEE